MHYDVLAVETLEETCATHYLKFTWRRSLLQFKSSLYKNNLVCRS